MSNPRTPGITEGRVRGCQGVGLVGYRAVSHRNEQSHCLEVADEMPHFFDIFQGLMLIMTSQDIEGSG